MLIFALISVHQNRLNKVLDKLNNLGSKYVNKVHLVYGEYDIIAELRALNPESSVNLLKEIKETDGVSDLKTYVVSDQLTDKDLPLVVEEY